MDIEAKDIVEIVEPSLKARITALIYGFIPHPSPEIILFSVFVSLSYRFTFTFK